MEKTTDVLILCGGMGSRLKPVVADRQKTMAAIDDRPFLDLPIECLLRQGFKRIILCTGHHAEGVEEYYSKMSNRAEFFFSREEKPMGTAGAILNAKRLIKNETLLVLNGDSFCDIPYKDFCDFFEKKKRAPSLALVDPRDRKDGGYVTIDDNHKILSFNEKEFKQNTFLSVGFYFFDRSILNKIPTPPASWEKDVFPALLKEGIYGYVSDKELFDIGTPERLDYFKQAYFGKKL